MVVSIEKYRRSRSSCDCDFRLELSASEYVPSTELKHVFDIVYHGNVYCVAYRSVSPVFIGTVSSLGSVVDLCKDYVLALPAPQSLAF